MKVVIDITDEEYEDVKKAGGCYYDFGKAIINGTPLPKGHGRIGDLDKILIWMIYKKGIINKLKCGEISPVFKDATIIEADKTESEEPRKGKWIVKGQEVYCSKCGSESAYNCWGASKFSDFCPNCGAKMESEV